jgi:hypothetical protein
VGLLERVRESCREVAGRARSVRIDRDRLSAFAASLAGREPPGLDPAIHHLGHGEKTVAFVLTLDAVNFGSGYFPHLRKRPGRSGYETIASSLADHFRTNGPLQAEELVRITPEACAALFGQDPADEPVRELMGHFARSLQDLGRYLLERFGGSPAALVEAAGHSAERLIGLLLEMPLYRDVHAYEGLQVAFYKRAQITAADLYWALGGRECGAFWDIDALTIFADNAVPHVLRMEGVLRYDPALASRIDRGELIPSGSPEEIEIRACALWAAEEMVETLRRMGYRTNAMRLDGILWHLHQEPHYRALPPHRTRTTDY